MYDFEKYYADMDVRAEVNLDLSGVQIENPQGNPNEHVTNNVAYYVTGIRLSNDAEFGTYVDIGIDERLEVLVREGNEDPSASYMSLLHPLADILDAGVTSSWNPGRKRETALDLDASYGDVTITYRILHDSGSGYDDFTHARLFVAPRYEFINGLGKSDIIDMISTGKLDPASVNQNIISDRSVNDLSATMRVIYTMLGIGGQRQASIRKFRTMLSERAEKYNAVIGYDTFRSRMSRITEWCAENNYGVDVKYYDESMSDPLQEGIEDSSDDEYRKDPLAARAKHRRYLAAVTAADKTRTDMGRFTSFKEAYGKHLPDFLNNPRIIPIIDDLTPEGDGVTALIPPLKDAAKGIFYPRGDIEQDFYEQFETVYNGVKDAMSIMRRHLSNSTKNKIRRLGAEYTNIKSDDAGLAFDMDSLINMLQANYDHLHDDLGSDSGVYAIGNLPEEHVVTVYPRVFQVNGEYVNDTVSGVEGYLSWGATPTPYSPGLHYVTPGDYKSENYCWNKSTVNLSSDEVRELLVDAYNWVLAKDDRVPLELGTDIIIDDNTFSYGYSGSAEEDPDIRVRQCMQFIEFAGGWMNLFRKCGTRDGVWQFMNEHPQADGETLMGWLARMVEAGEVEWNLTGEYRVLSWDTSSSTSSGAISYSRFVPGYDIEWVINPGSPDDIDRAVRAASVMIDAYKDMRSRLVSSAFMMSPFRVVRAWRALEDVSDSIDDLKGTLDRIIWYQSFVNESVFTNHSMYLDFSDWLHGDGDDTDGYLNLPFVPWTLPARFMVPVAMYRKVRRKYKKWGRTRHRTVKVYSGVRWAEVRFYDLNVFGEYPQIEDTPGTTVQLGKTATVSESAGKWYVSFGEPLPESVWNAGNGELTFDDLGRTTLQVEFDGDMSAHVPEGVDPPALTGEHTVLSVKVPPERSRNDTENRTPVTVHLKVPSLPYDEEIRKTAFVEYGPLSQDRMFEVTRNGDGGFPGIDDSSRIDGWKVFRATSRKIEDMREGIGLYDKVAFLLSILGHEFGSNRVELINTWRSEDDQKGICTGGPESSMLSWHNYGMAAKILIYQSDCTTPIVDGSEDMRRLVKVARAFTDICGDGRIGQPCNVVWCGRLTVNPSLFDWEFLPVGVGHKDAFRFREAIMAQRDPVMECSYVDVDASGIAMPSPPADDSPYVLTRSSAYRNAIVIGGHHYVSPDSIVNYRTPDDIVLYDIVEYIDLINLKIGANGSTLGARKNIYEWKSVNDSACSQLIRYFALTNNIKSAKALIAGDFVERYQAIEDAYYSRSAVDYVKNMLGENYSDAYLSVDSMRDAGFISLANGKMYIRPHDVIPDNAPTIADMHGQQRVDENHVRRGVWRGGVFYGLDEIDIPYVESDGPVIEGYVDGVASYGEAMFLHHAVASEIHAAFLKIRDMFERYSGTVMYDRFMDGPNAGKFDQLENEFGAIQAQDLMDFDDLESMLAMDDINRLADIETNGERNGAGGGSIYEKVVNNAQLAGMRKAVRTSERMHITDRGNGLTPGEIYRAVMEGRAPGANDIMGR